jgi:hypothetical protein
MAGSRPPQRRGGRPGYREVARSLERSRGRERTCRPERPRPRSDRSWSCRMLTSSRNWAALDGRRPSSSAPPSRPSRPPNPRAARTRSAVSRELSRPSTPGPWFLRTCLYFVADPDRVHHDGPPSRPGVLAVSVSLRHQRSSVTVQRPPQASSRSATGRTNTPLRTTATVSASRRQVA